MSDEPRPLDNAEIVYWEESAKRDFHPPIVCRLLATIHDRERKLAAYQASAEDLSKALDDTKRAEAFALYRECYRYDLSQYREWVSPSPEQMAGQSIEAAAAFNTEWEKAHE